MFNQNLQSRSQNCCCICHPRFVNETGNNQPKPPPAKRQRRTKKKPNEEIVSKLKKWREEKFYSWNCIFSPHFFIDDEAIQRVAEDFSTVSLVVVEDFVEEITKLIS